MASVFFLSANFLQIRPEGITSKSGALAVIERGGHSCSWTGTPTWLDVLAARPDLAERSLPLVHVLERLVATKSFRELIEFGGERLVKALNICWC
jgi:hypothetical protein